MYEGAEEVGLLLDGWVLTEDFATGNLVWHKVVSNMTHADVPNIVDLHKVKCGAVIHANVHPAPNGHHTCPTCSAP